MEWYFVRPENDAELSENQQLAYNLMTEYDLNPSWIDAEECQSLKADKIKTRFFVCDPFSGAAFKHLKKQNCRILGPKCVKDAIDKGDVQNVPYPIYNSVMAGLHITYTGFKAEKRQQLMEKIQYMGGQTNGQYTAQITHLIADEVGSKKYQVAVEFNTPVMLSDWVTECWNRSQTEDISATDAEFDKFRTPVFKGLVVTLTQADFDERKRIQELVEKNGGVYTGDLRSRHATHLIAWQPTGKKFFHATQWGIHCVTVDWLDESVRKGYKVKEGLYTLKKDVESQPVTSSPQATTKDNLIGNLTTSFISSSAVDETYVASRDSSIYRPNDPVNTKSALDNLEMAVVYRAGSIFLDGCRFFLSGFNNSEMEKIRRIINLGGGTRLNELSEAATHCLVNSCKIEQVVSQIECKRWRPKVVKVEWLVDSCYAGFIVDENPYLLWEPSETKMLPPEPRIEPPENKPLDADTLEEDQKILSQYLELNSQGSGLNDTVDLESTDQTGDAELNGDEEEQTGKLFSNKTITVIGFTLESLTSLHQTVEENGGHILSQEDGVQVPDFTIVPMEGMKSLKNVSKVATNTWLLACVERGSILPLDSDPLFTPIRLDLSVKPLSGCVLCISQFTSIERESLCELAVLLGAKYQDTLVRKANVQNKLLGSTHLICKEAEGGKYRGAVRWGIPVVYKTWLTDCAAQGKRLSEKKYRVGVSEGPETSGKSKGFITPKKNSGSVENKKRNEVEMSSNNCRSFLFDKSDFSDLRAPETVKRKDVNVRRSIESLKEVFTPVSAAKPKRLNELRLDGLNSSGQKGESSDGVRPSTPARFLNPSTNFEPKLTFSPDDCAKNQSSDAVSSLAEFFRDNLQSAKDKSKPFGALANLKPRDSGAFFPDDVEKTGPLKGVVMGVSKKLRSDQGRLNDLISALGGDYRWTFDKTCTHFVYQGKLTENWADLKQAKAKGIPIVAPEWVQACSDKNAFVCENAYPSNFNPKMMLDISTSQIERTPRPTQSEKAPRTTQSESTPRTTQSERTPRTTQSERTPRTTQSKSTPRTTQSDGTARTMQSERTPSTSSREKLIESAVDMSLVSEADQSVENATTMNDEETNCSGRESDGVNRAIGAILAMTSSQKSNERNRNSKIPSSSPPNVSGERPFVLSLSKTSINQFHGVQGEPSQSIPIVWGDLMDKSGKETKESDATCVDDDDETQLNQEMSALKQNADETAIADDKSSNKENRAMEEEEEEEEEDEEEDEEEEAVADKDVPKPIPRFMLSGFPNDERIELEEMIESLGGVVSKQQAFDSTSTHLVVSQPSRNEKCLASIAGGLWMLHKSYLVRCTEEQSFVDEASFEWGGEGIKSTLNKLSPQLQKIAICSQKWRLKLAEEGDASGPFTKWNVVIHTDKNRASSFKRVLEAGGAEISECEYPFSDSLDRVTHAFLELHREGIAGGVDLTALLDAKIHCLKPEFIASCLMDDNTNEEEFIIPEVRPKRKSNSVNASNKRNRRV